MQWTGLRNCCGGRRLGIVGADVGVVGLVAVGAPIALHLAGVGVEHRHALVEIAVRDIGLVGFRVDPDLGDAAEVLQVVAALVAAEMADLHDELAVIGELEDVGILLAVAADPDIALVVHMDAVVRLRPLVAGARTAPRPQQRAVRIVDQDRRSGAAAIRDRRIELGAALVVMQAAGAAMDDPDVIEFVDPDADGPAQQPVVGQRLRPQRIDFEDGGLHGRGLRLGLLLQQGLADAEADNAGRQGRAVDECAVT